MIDKIIDFLINWLIGLKIFLDIILCFLVIGLTIIGVGMFVCGVFDFDIKYIIAGILIVSFCLGIVYGFFYTE